VSSISSSHAAVRWSMETPRALASIRRSTMFFVVSAFFFAQRPVRIVRRFFVAGQTKRTLQPGPSFDSDAMCHLPFALVCSGFSGTSCIPR